MPCNSSIIVAVSLYAAEKAMSVTKSTIQGAKALQGHTAVRHCKIVATIGPSSSDEANLRTMIEAGLDIVRLNFSHGDHAAHLAVIEIIRRLANRVRCKCHYYAGLTGAEDSLRHAHAGYGFAGW